MRTTILALATAAAGLAIAAPASAQYYPPQQQPRYGAPYGNAYGYNNNYGQYRSLQARVDNLQRQINRLDKRDVIRNREADRLRNAARDIERRLRYSGQNGLNPREAYVVQTQLVRLEQRVQLVARDGRRWGSRDNRWNSFWSDYDRDGRNDRYEDDRGTRRDR